MFRQLHALPFMAKPVGAALLFVNVPVRPMVTAAPGEIVVSYDTLVAVTLAPDCV